MRTQINDLEKFVEFLKGTIILWSSSLIDRWTSLADSAATSVPSSTASNTVSDVDRPFRCSFDILLIDQLDQQQYNDYIWSKASPCIEIFVVVGIEIQSVVEEISRSNSIVHISSADVWNTNDASKCQCTNRNTDEERKSCSKTFRVNAFFYFDQRWMIDGDFRDLRAKLEMAIEKVLTTVEEEREISPSNEGEEIDEVKQWKTKETTIQSFCHRKFSILTRSSAAFVTIWHQHCERCWNMVSMR